MDQNKDNNHHPKAWLGPSVAALVFLIVFSFFASITHRVIISRTGYLADVLPRVLVDLTNNNRLASNVGGLKTNPMLEEAARRKAADMAEKSYFAHYSPEGLSPWYFIQSVNYDFIYAGENLAVFFSDSEDVVDAWMDSPGHRENILNQNFTEIGIATSKGYYKGEETIFVVQMFGKPNVAFAAELTPEETVKEDPIPTLPVNWEIPVTLREAKLASPVVFSPDNAPNPVILPPTPTLPVVVKVVP